MKRLQFLLILSLIIIFGSCNSEKCKCLKSTGEYAEILINTDEYHRVETFDNFNIILSPDTINYIKVSGGKNLISFVEYELEDGILKIYDKNKCKWLRKYEQLNLEIGLGGVEKITFWESANIQCADTLHYNWFAFENHTKYSKIHLLVNCRRLEFWAHAATGDYYIEGKTDIAFFHNAGNGYLHAENFRAKRADITHISTGNSKINVSDSLHIININHGKVYLNNCPTISCNDSTSLLRLISDCR